MKETIVPVSCFLSCLTETVPPGSEAKKYGMALAVPEWIPENCIQCSRCFSACPAMAIRPVILKEEGKQAICASYPTIKMTGEDGYRFAISVSLPECTGCGACVSVCPGKEEKKALQLEKSAVYVDRKNQK